MALTTNILQYINQWDASINWFAKLNLNIFAAKEVDKCFTFPYQDQEYHQQLKPSMPCDTCDQQ